MPFFALNAEPSPVNSRFLPQIIDCKRLLCIFFANMMISIDQGGGGIPSYKKRKQPFSLKRDSIQTYV